MCYLKRYGISIINNNKIKNVVKMEDLRKE